MSRLLVMIKPWSIEHAEDILAELDKHGIRLKTTRIEEIRLEDIAEHYAAHWQRTNYQGMINDFVGLPAVLTLYIGDYDKFGDLKGEIRQKYYSDIPSNPNHQRNALHVSGLEEEFLHEIEVWKIYFPCL